MKGTTRKARSLKIGVFSLFGSRCLPRWGDSAPSVSVTRLPLVDEVGAECCELLDDVFVAAADDAHVADGGLPFGAERGNEVTEAAAQVRDADVRTVQRCRALDDGGLLEVAPGY